MLQEVRQSQKDEYCMIPPNEIIYNSPKFVTQESRMVVAKSGGKTRSWYPQTRSLN